MTTQSHFPSRGPCLIALIMAASLATVTAQPTTAHAPAAPEVSTPATALWTSTGNPDRPLREPAFLAVDPQGRLWVVDSHHSQIQILAPDGMFLEVWGQPGTGPGQFDFVRGDEMGLGAVAFAPDGTIYVADTGNDRVQVFTPDRQWLAAWGSSGRDDGQFIDPIGIAVGPDGLIYVVDDYRDDVQVFDHDGIFVRRFGAEGSGPGQFLDAGSGLAFDHDGNVLVADSGDDQVERFAPDGQSLGARGGTGSAPGWFYGPQEIAVDAEGRVYVADSSNYRVQVFAADGALLATWGSVGSEPGQFRYPVGLALDTHGAAYVSDTFDNRIQAFHLQPPLAPG